MTNKQMVEISMNSQVIRMLILSFCQLYSSIRQKLRGSIIIMTFAPQVKVVLVLFFLSLTVGEFRPGGLYEQGLFFLLILIRRKPVLLAFEVR